MRARAAVDIPAERPDTRVRAAVDIPAERQGTRAAAPGHIEAERPDIRVVAAVADDDTPEEERIAAEGLPSWG